MWQIGALGALNTVIPRRLSRRSACLCYPLLYDTWTSCNWYQPRATFPGSRPRTHVTVTAQAFILEAVRTALLDLAWERRASKWRAYIHAFPHPHLLGPVRFENCKTLRPRRCRVHPATSCHSLFSSAPHLGVARQNPTHRFWYQPHYKPMTIMQPHIIHYYCDTCH